jgi:uncharacterized protein (TIGR02996 family)
MTQEDAFIQAIIDNPEDDATRLIFADWLEENGQPERAGFIRYQIEHTQPPTFHSRRPKMEKREAAILRKWGRRWFAPPKGWKVGSQFTVRRGFPETLEMGTIVLFSHDDDVFSRWPITRLRLEEDDQSGRLLMRQLAKWPYLERIGSLSMYSLHLGAASMQPLGESPGVRNLVELDVGSNDLRDQGASALAASPHLAGLREIDIRHNLIGPAGLRDWIRSPHREAMVSLNLCGNQVSAANAIAFLRSDGWPALTDLCLWNTRFGDKSVEKLAASPALARLTALNLNYNRITDRGVEALANSPHAPKLRTLLLAVNDITSKSGSVLIDSPNLEGLGRLNLYGNSGIHWRTKAKLKERFGDRVSFDEPW